MSQEFSQEPVPPLPQKSRSNVNGCLIGCLIVFVVGLVGAGLVAFAMYKGLQTAVNEWTETEPRELPALEITDEERAAATDKFERFKTAMEEESGEKEFSFTGDEINFMLRSHPEAVVFGESVYVTVEDGEIRGDVSLNLGDIIPIGMFDGRYANGSAVFDVYTQDDRLFVFIESFQMKGEDPPPDISQQLRNQNLAQEMAGKPKFEAWMAEIQDIRVVEDRIVVTLN